MPAQQQDYIVRHLQTISRLVARLRQKGKLLGAEDQAELNDALLLALQLQERNFGRPAAEFLALSADQQFEALCRTETKAIGHERCLTYASLLRTTADRSDVHATVDDLLRILDGAELLPPTAELLAEYSRQA